MMRNQPLDSVNMREPAFHLTKEEQDFVRNCLDKELWKSELPSAIASGLLAKVAMKFGYFRQSKVTLFSVMLGTFVCSRAFSYNMCFQKLLQLPGSTLAERINLKKKGVIPTPADPYANQAVLLPTERDPHLTPQPNYLEDINRPDYPENDSILPSPADPEPQPFRPTQSYSDLRRQNREAYQSQYRTVRPPPPALEVPLTPQPSQEYSTPSSYDPPTPPRRTRVNKYGDVWED